MTNGEKFKTAQERTEAFYRYCHNQACSNISAECKHENCVLEWLDLEAEEEKPLPCPFCGGENVSCEHCTEKHSETNEESAFVAVVCYDCGYQGKNCDDESEAIAAHNRVAKVVKESKVK